MSGLAALLRGTNSQRNARDSMYDILSKMHEYNAVNADLPSIFDLGMDESSFAKSAERRISQSGIGGAKGLQQAYYQEALERGLSLQSGSLGAAGIYDRYGVSATDAISNLTSMLIRARNSGFYQGEYARMEEYLRLQQGIMQSQMNWAGTPSYDYANEMISRFANMEGYTVDQRTGSDIQALQNMVLNPRNDRQRAILKKELTAVTNVTTSFQQQKQELQKLIDKYKDYIAQIDAAIKKKKEEATGVTTSGGTSSSGSNNKPPTTSTPNNNKPSSGSSGGSASSPKAPTTGSKVRVKPGRRWYYDSQGMNPSGPTDKYANQDLYVVNTSKNKYQYAVGKTTNINSGLGWLRKEDLVGFDTGGYTGSWGKEGKLAMLHEKEIVLNKQDTSNILEAVKLMRKDNKSNSIANIASVIIETSAKTINALSSFMNSMMPNANAISGIDSNNPIEQNITIEADFSGVRNADEIEKAFANIQNMASQYANRTR